MSLFWHEQFSVGNNLIDSDHKYLIEAINRVEQSFGTKDRSELAAAFNTVLQYSRVHFAREEKIAHAVGYKQVPHLNQSHQELLKQIDQLWGEIDALGLECPLEAIRHATNFLRYWLIDHIIREDRLMKPILQQYSPNFYPE
jgi:hemerythrin